MRLTKCPKCVDGIVVNSNGVVLSCSLCQGTNVVTPDNICACGLPCLHESGGIHFCGDEKCYQTLKFKTPIRPHTYPNWAAENWE